MYNCVFNFNILAIVLFGILEGSQIYIRGPCAPRRPLSRYRRTVLEQRILIIAPPLRAPRPNPSPRGGPLGLTLAHAGLWALVG